MESAEIYSRIEADRRARWRRYREARGMAEDAPFVGRHPLLECYDEALDALNYLHEAARQLEKRANRASRVSGRISRAAYHAEIVARICLDAMELLRQQGGDGG